METSHQDFNQLNQTQRRIAHDEMVLTTEIDWLGTSTPQLQAGSSGSEKKCYTEVSATTRPYGN